MAKYAGRQSPEPPLQHCWGGTNLSPSLRASLQPVGQNGAPPNPTQCVCEGGSTPNHCTLMGLKDPPPHFHPTHSSPQQHTCAHACNKHVCTPVTCVHAGLHCTWTMHSHTHSTCARWCCTQRTCACKSAPQVCSEVPCWVHTRVCSHTRAQRLPVCKHTCVGVRNGAVIWGHHS